MEQTASRRAFLSAGIATVATTGVLASAALASESTSELNRLWTAWLTATEDYLRVSKLHHEAEQLVPWWAKSGPSYLFSDGTIGGYHCGWPAIQNMELPEGIVRRLIRVSKYDIQKECRRNLSYLGKERASAIFKKGMREFVKRRRAQMHEVAKHGLPAMEAELDRFRDVGAAIEDQIRALPAGGFHIAQRL